ncbi:MAG: AI-2E family transporter, partial [Lachnospiraceae bacterium]|nr:AI-2E family transporter [Lachnospiraceae bacterium]
MKWMGRVNKRYIRMTVFLAVAVLVIKIVSQLTDHAAEIFAAVMTGLNWIIGVAKPIIFGFVMAYILKPLNDFFTERYARVRFLKKCSRALGVVTVLLLVVLIIIGIVSAIVYSVTNQLQVANVDQLFGAISAITKSVTDFYAELMEKLKALDIQSEQIASYVEKLSASVMGVVQSLANGVIGSVSNISGYITTIMFGLVIGIYFMIDGNSIMSYFSGVADAVLPDRTNSKIRSVLQDLNEIFSGYIRGQLLDITFMIFATGTAMMLTGISLAPIIGLVTGLANLVPYLGPFVGYSSIIIISVVEGEYQIMVASLIALFVIQTLDGNIIAAK